LGDRAPWRTPLGFSEWTTTGVIQPQKI